MNDVRIRRFTSEDSIDDLTSLIHRAFSRFARVGLQCTGVEQSLATTRARVHRGTCFVAARGAHLVGTLTLETPGPRRECEWYRRTEVASLHQFAVDPSDQHRGWGALLLQFAQRWTAGQRYGELALDTPADAARLVAYYESYGFRRVGEYQKPGRAYRSVVLSKRIANAVLDDLPWRSPHRAAWA